MPATLGLELIDGDAAFVRVDNKRPPNMLMPGEVADAINLRFDEGKVRPRYGVSWQRWGLPGVDMIAASGFTVWNGTLKLGDVAVVAGQTYFFLPSGQAGILNGEGTQPNITTPGFFTAKLNSVGLFPVGNQGTKPISAVILRMGTPLGYARFTAPDTTDNTVLVTADWRDQAGEDGGYGRAWRITAGNVPQQIPMNGHDAWDVVRLVACYNGLAMLRGARNERHYFSAKSVAMQGPTSIPATSDRARTSNVATLTVTAHGLSTGMYVTVTGVGGTGYNLADVMVTKIDANNFSYPSTGGNEGTTADTGGHVVLVGGPCQLNLNCVPGWNDGDLVEYNFAIPGSGIYGPQPPAAGAQYYVKSVGGTIGVPPTTGQTVLYLDQACTNPLTITTVNTGGSLVAPNGSFYLERQAASPGPYGNGAPTLLIQGAVGQTPFQTGFLATPLSVAITGNASNVVTAPNHRLVQGDAVTVTGLTHSSSPLANPVYAVPLSKDTVQFYDTQVHALAAQGTVGNTGLITIDSSPQTGTLVKSGASALAMPPAREGIYFLQRLIVVNGINNILISDPLDPLHYAPLSAQITANLGENQPVTGLIPLGKSTLLFILPDFILALYNLNLTATNWVLDEVTRQYGGLSGLAAVRVGTDAWSFGRKGVFSVTKTEFGELSGVDVPVSDAIPKYIGQCDWAYANLACAENWDNRTFIAFPQKGQTGTRMNNAVIVFNGLNKFLQVSQEVEEGQLRGGIVPSSEQPYAWEGLWQGNLLTPVDFARLNIAGEERLTFVNAQGMVCWLSDDWYDMGASIGTILTPRAYWGGEIVNARQVFVNWDTYNPNLSVTALTASYNESYPAAVNVTYDPTQYLVWTPQGTDTNYNAPFRQDYSQAAGAVYTVGEALPVDVFQNITEKFPVRMRGRNPQISIANSQGSCKINSITMKACAVGMTASNQT